MARRWTPITVESDVFLMFSQKNKNDPCHSNSLYQNEVAYDLLLFGHDEG